MRLRKDRIIDRDTLRCIHDTLEWNLSKEKVIVEISRVGKGVNRVRVC